MIKLIRSTILVITLLGYPGLSAQTIEHLPFELSGQYGLGIVRSFSLWHQDWRWGALVFDGALVPDPYRLHPRIGAWATNDFSEFSPSFDTTNVSKTVNSSFNYQRGDFSLNTLEIEFNFPQPNRNLTIEAYKRSYVGGHGEYLHPDGQGMALQQSYFLDYLTQPTDNHAMEISAGHFITHSGMLLGYSSAGLNQYDTNFGLRSKMEINQWICSSHASVNLHRRKFYNTANSLSISRKVVEDQIGFKLAQGNEQGNVFWIGGEYSYQGARTAHSDYLGIQTGFRYRILDGKLGLASIGSKIFPAIQSGLYWESEYSHITGKLALQPQALPLSFVQETGKQGANWIEASLLYNREIGILDLLFSTDYRRATDYYEWYVISDSTAGQLRLLQAGFMQAGAEFILDFSDDWHLHGSYRHVQTASPTLTDGIGDRFKLRLDGHVKILFRGRLDLLASLDIQGWFNRDARFGYNPIDEVPYSRDYLNGNLTNVFPIGLELQAEVSKVKLTYRIENLGYLLDRQLHNSATAVMDQWNINSNSYFPDLGKLIWFSVSWRFID